MYPGVGATSGGMGAGGIGASGGMGAGGMGASGGMAAGAGGGMGSSGGLPMMMNGMPLNPAGGGMGQWMGGGMMGAGGMIMGGGAPSGQDHLVREQDRFLPIANISRIMRRVLPPNAKVAKDSTTGNPPVITP